MIGDRIKELRQKLNNLTQADFAKPIGIPLTAISKYETGQINPSFEVLSKIGRIYEVNLNWLIMGDGEIFMSKNLFSQKIVKMLETIESLEPVYQEEIFKYIDERKKLYFINKN